MFEKYWEIQRAKAAGEREDSGFTLIELLIVIVVLGILAATVIFALGGVTGQSAVAACNSDAKSYEVAIAAYGNSPLNTTNAPAAATTDLTAPTFGGSAFLQQASNNTAFKIDLKNDLPAGYLLNGATVTGGANTGIVYVGIGTSPTAFWSYDSEGATHGCAVA